LGQTAPVAVAEAEVEVDVLETLMTAVEVRVAVEVLADLIALEEVEGTTTTVVLLV